MGTILWKRTSELSSVKAILIYFDWRKFHLTCVNDLDESSDEEVYAEHGVVSGQDETAQHKELLENYLNFDDEDCLVSKLWNLYRNH